jgi:DNA uptake protein ComE-like DNA-binding protein
MSKAEKQQAQGKILDLNTASKEELAALPGVGPSYAQKIIDGRPYKDKRDLLRKRVLPENIYNQIKDRVIARRETIKAKPKDAPTNREQ